MASLWIQQSVGHIVSKDGRFEVVPVFEGRQEPQHYTLVDKVKGKEYKRIKQQAHAKAKADAIKIMEGGK